MAPPEKRPRGRAQPLPVSTAPAGARKPKPPNRFAGFSRKRIRQEIDSRALEMLLATITGLRTDIDGASRRLVEVEREAPLLTRVSALEAELRLLRRYLDEAGLRPPDRIQPPEFVSPAPTVVVDAAAAPADVPISPAIAEASDGAPRVHVLSAKWGARDEAQGVLAMHAVVVGVPDDTEALFRIFERGETMPFGIEAGTVKEGRIDAGWQFGKVGLALDFTQWPTFYFVVEVGGVQAESNLIAGGVALSWNQPSEP